jgi:hypothetical protein
MHLALQNVVVAVLSPTGKFGHLDELNDLWSGFESSSVHALCGLTMAPNVIYDYLRLHTAGWGLTNARVRKE